MQVRLTQQFAFQQVREGLQGQLNMMARAQEQLSSGERLHRPSDDPEATARVLNLQGQLSAVEAHAEAIEGTRPVVDSASSALQQATGLMADARAAMVGAMNGTLSPSDRQILADQIDGIRTSLLAVANTHLGDNYVFGGTESMGEPFVEVAEGGVTRVVYTGGSEGNTVNIGNGQSIEVAIQGDEIFGRTQPTGVEFAGLTGAVPGIGPDQGEGYGMLQLRQDGTSGTLGAGLAFVAAGASDTILGDKVVTIDATAGTAQLGSGPTRSIPGPGSPDLADFRLLDEDGSEIHLDFSSYTGADFTGTVTGAGSVSFDGSPFVALNFTDTNLELEDSTGRILHVDTTGITRAGEELVTFGGTLTVFDVLAGAADDLRSSGTVDPATVTARLNSRFSDLAVGEEDIVQSLARIGVRAERLDAAQDRISGVMVHLEGVISGVKDADVIDVVTQLTQAEQTLQVAQAAGARMLQQSLLNFL